MSTVLAESKAQLPLKVAVAGGLVKLVMGFQ
jgi:hypothetical protein